MILPIYGYGQPVLKKQTQEVDPAYPALEELITNMWETMYNAHGVGLAGPQVGLALRIFLVDTEQVKDDEKLDFGIKKVFLNAEILEEEGEPWSYEEGCLSIPDIRGEVERLPAIRIRYQDERFAWHEETYAGLNARVIQHEYDHIEGVLFTEKLKPLKRRLIKKKLEMIRTGQVQSDYKMRFAVRIG
ncbi:MAG: peptide deformylase [Saprospiraceae bacterium]|nr:peptide deformylase [Saprospiraceae bacterium]